MDEAVDHPLPPFRIALAMRVEPAVVRRPMARLVLLDDAEDLGQLLVAKHVAVLEQDFDLLMSAPLGQRDHPAHSSRQGVAHHNARLVEIIDARAEHDPDKAVDMPEGAVERVGHYATPLEPAA